MTKAEFQQEILAKTLPLIDKPYRNWITGNDQFVTLPKIGQCVNIQIQIYFYLAIY